MKNEMNNYDNFEDFDNTSSDSLIFDKNRNDTPTSEELKQLSKRDKFLYFKEYYLPYILAVLAIIAGLTWAILSFRATSSKKDTFYCGMMTGVQFDEATQKAMPEMFSTYLKKSGYNGYIKKDRTFFETFYSTYTDDVKLDGYYDSKRFDAFITRDSQFEIYASNDNIYDLSKILPADLLEKISDKLVYVSVNGKDAVPYGILLKDIKYEFYDGTGEKIDPPILSIPSNTKRLEAAIKFVAFITETK